MNLMYPSFIYSYSTSFLWCNSHIRLGLQRQYWQRPLRIVMRPYLHLILRRHEKYPLIARHPRFEIQIQYTFCKHIVIIILQNNCECYRRITYLKVGVVCTRRICSALFWQSEHHNDTEDSECVDNLRINIHFIQNVTKTHNLLPGICVRSHRAKKTRFHRCRSLQRRVNSEHQMQCYFGGHFLFVLWKLHADIFKIEWMTNKKCVLHLQKKFTWRCGV